MNRAAVLTEYDEPLEIQERDPLTPPTDGIVVATEACGICRSDWHGWKGHWPGTPPEDDDYVLGHEPAGTVVGVGDDVESFREGDEVGIPFNIACGHCGSCWDGHSHICDDGLSLGFSPELSGAFATEFAIPHAEFNATRLPESMSAVEMAGLGCRFATAFHGLAHKATVEAGDWVAVHGCGGIGLSAVHVADALGASVVAVDLNDEPLEMAKQLGAEVTVSAEVDDVPKTICDATDGGADVSVDALGIAETCQNSVRSLTNMGQHLQIGMTTADEGGDVELPVDAMLNDELEFIGVKGMPPNRYDELLRMIDAGQLSPAELVTRRVGLEDVSDRLRAMDEFGTVGIEVVTEF